MCIFFICFFFSGVVEEGGEEVGKCFAYDLDETLALENLVIVQGVPTPDRCAPAYLNCLLYRMNQLVQKRNPNTRTLLVRSRLESFEDSDAAQDTGETLNLLPSAYMT